ncbi:PAS domain S-box protein [Aquiflexum sp.]|uniref:PAS domain S-box protein n=1 Tax=Aquiflexum sp. TaxID=1872584 RepID=UPI003593223E
MVFIGLLTWKNKNIHEEYNELVSHTHEVILQSEKTFSLVKDIETGSRGFVLSGDSIFLVPFFDAKHKIFDQLEVLKYLTKDNVTQKSRIDSLLFLSQKKIEFVEEIIHARNKSGTDAAEILMESLRGQRYMGQIGSILSGIDEEQGELLSIRNLAKEETEATFDKSFYFLLSLAIAILLFGFIVIRKTFNSLKKVENELFLKNQWYNQTLLSLGDGVIATDFHGVVTFLNQAAQQLTGWKDEEALGKSITEIFKINNSKTGFEVINPLLEAIHKNQVVLLSNHTILKRKDNSELFIDDSGAPINDKGGRTIGGVLVFRDITEKKQAEDKIVAAEKRFSTIVNISPIAISISEFETGIFLHVNDAYCELIGRTKEELIGNDSIRLNIISQDQRSGILDLIQSSGGAFDQTEIQIRNELGAKADVLCSMEKIEVDGKTCLISYLLDITERKRIENELKILNETLEKKVEEKTNEIIGNEIFFKKMLDNLKEGIQILDKEFNYIYLNRVAEAQSRFSKEELIGRSLLDKYPESSGSNLNIAIRECIITGTSKNFENEFSFPDGSKAWFDLIVEPIEEGILIISTDITLKKKSEEEILQKNIFMNQLMRTQKVSFYAASALDFRLVFLTENIKNITGHSADAFFRKKRLWLENIYPEDKKWIIPKMKNKINSLGKGDFEFRWNYNDGTTKWILNSFQVIEDHSGIKWIYGSLIDLTKRKNTEKTLEDQNKELIKKNEELDRFVYSTSHDLRAPLASLLGLISISQSSIDNGKNGLSERLQMMKQSVVKLDGFIGDILNYSYNSRTEIQIQEICFKNKIQGIIQNLEFINVPEGFKMNVNINQDNDFVSDKRRISIIINNLISNGIKLQDKSKPNPFLNISLVADDKKAVLIVKDNGVGIAEEDLDRIFEMFYRANKDAKGSGLGLYIIKEAIEKVNGSIEVTSALNIGSTFKVTFPNLK